MGFIKFIVWTACAMGIGVYISTAPYPDGPPLQQAQRFFRRHLPPGEVEALEKEVKAVVRSAKTAVTAAPKPPVEQHSPEEREAVNKLISKRAPTR